MDNHNQIRRLRQIVGTEESIAILGDGAGVIFVVGKNGFVWVRDPQTHTVRDLPLASSLTFDKDAHGKPVRLGYVRGVLSVLGIHREAVISGGGNIYIDNPTQAPVLPFIPQQRIMPLVVYPASVSGAPSFELIVRAWMWIDDDHQIHFFGGDRVDVSGHLPSTGLHRWIMVSITDALTLSITASTPQSTLDPLTLSDLQEALDLLNADEMPIWGWVLNGDAVGLSENDVNQDLRQFIVRRG